MQIENALLSQNYSNDKKQNHAQTVENIFHNLINDDGDFNISFDEEELKSLTFQEAKELKIKLEDNGYLQDVNDDINHGISENSSGLLKVVTFTYDEEFNQSLFNTMKSKDNPKVFLEEMIHNIEYSEGKRENLWPTVSIEETQGEYTALNDNEIKNIDIKEFLQTTIKAYEQLLSTISTGYDQEDTAQSLHDLKEISNGYHTQDSEKNALLSSIMRVNRPNPLMF